MKENKLYCCFSVPLRDYLAQQGGGIFKIITKKEYYNYKNKLNRKEWCFIWQI